MSDIVNVPMAAQRDIRTVTAEIRSLHRQAQCMVLGYAIEIGRKLKEAKTLLPYGQWGRWLQEEVEFSQSTAQNFMKIFEEYGARQVSLFGDAESQTLGNLPYTHALKLLALPAEEREEFAREHHVEDLSSRELEKLLRERDEARAKAEAAERASADARTESDGLGKKLAAAQGFAQELQEQLTRAKRAAETARQELEDQKKNQKVPEETMAQLRADAAKNAEAALADKLQKAKDREKKASDRVVELEKALELKRDLDRRRVEELEKQLGREPTVEEIAKDEKDSQNIYLAELDYAALAEIFPRDYRYKPLSPFAAVKRDLALVCQESITCGDLEQTIRKASSLVSDVSLFDVYRGKNLGEGKKSMAFSLTLSDPEKELPADQVDRAINKILKDLKFKLGVEMR